MIPSLSQQRLTKGERMHTKLLSTLQRNWTKVEIIQRNWITVDIIKRNWIKVEMIQRNWMNIEIIQRHWLKVEINQRNWIKVEIIQRNWITIEIKPPSKKLAMKMRIKLGRNLVGTFQCTSLHFTDRHQCTTSFANLISDISTTSNLTSKVKVTHENILLS